MGVDDDDGDKGKAGREASLHALKDFSLRARGCRTETTDEAVQTGREESGFPIYLSLVPVAGSVGPPIDSWCSSCQACCSKIMTLRRGNTILFAEGSQIQ